MHSLYREGWQSAGKIHFYHVTYVSPFIWLGVCGTGQWKLWGPVLLRSVFFMFTVHLELPNLVGIWVPMSHCRIGTWKWGKQWEKNPYDINAIWFLTYIQFLFVFDKNYSLSELKNLKKKVWKVNSGPKLAWLDSPGFVFCLQGYCSTKFSGRGCSLEIFY